MASDQNQTHTIPSTGPNGDETIITIVANETGAGAGGPVVSAFAFVATSNESASTLNVTPSATEQWAAIVIKVPAGEFDATTPIQSNTGQAGSSSASDTTASSPAWTTDATPDGRPVVFVAADTDDISGTVSNWTVVANQTTSTRIGCIVAVRDTGNSGSESISAEDWTIAGDTNASIGYVVNEPAGGASIGPLAFYHLNFTMG